MSERKKVAGYKGVYVKEWLSGNMRGERLFYISYRDPSGTQHMEVAGYKGRDGMTAARAQAIRADKIRGAVLPKTEQRRIEKESGETWTLNRLWAAYDESKCDRSARQHDVSRWRKYIAPICGEKETCELDTFTLDRMKKATRTVKTIVDKATIVKTQSDQTVHHVLNLLRRVVNYGFEEKDIPPVKIRWNKAMPVVHNEKTDHLSEDQKNSLVTLLHREIARGNAIAGIMFLVFHSGMRRSEPMELLWSDVDLSLGRAYIRKPKEVKPKQVFLDEEAVKFLEKWPHRGEYVFSKSNGKRYSNITNGLRRLRDDAGLPKDMRPLHSLRHHWATTAASNGVSLSVIGRQLGHSPKNMTSTTRYAHILDEALIDAVGIVNNALAGKKE